MTDDKRPREFELFYSGLSGQLMARNYQQYELGPDDLYLIAVEKSAYDSLAKKLEEAEAEVERLKDTPGGKRLYLTFNELTREREITQELRAEIERLHGLGKKEEWRQVVDFENYWVSNFGQVKSEKTVLQTTLMRGYALCGLWLNGKRFSRPVHRLVLEAFVGLRPEGKEAAHINGVRDDNRLENLMWATKEENAKHRDLHGTTMKGDNHFRAKLKESDIPDILDRLAKGESCASIARVYGVSRSTISLIKRGGAWRDQALTAYRKEFPK